MSARGRYVTWAAPAGRAGRPAPRAIRLPRLTGAAWTAWRRHRALYRLGAFLVAAAVVWAVWQRHQLVSGMTAYADACRRTPAACSPSDLADPPSPPPQPAILSGLFDLTSTVLAFLPVGVGAFLGAPLFAQDLENGTYRLAWTQSVSRRQWAGAKLGVAAGATALGATVLSAAASWWWLTCWRGQRAAGETGSAWRSLTEWDRWDFFAATGPVVVAHALLALLLGAALGLVIRRTLPAVAASAAASTAALLGLDRLRPRLLPHSIRTVAGTGGEFPNAPRDAWHFGNGYLTSTGGRLPSGVCDDVAPQTPVDTCLSAAHVVGRFSDDYRMSQFLPLQALETGVCLAAGAALTGFCLWHVGRMTAAR